MNYSALQKIDLENKEPPIIHYKQSKVQYNKRQLNHTMGIQIRKNTSVPLKNLGCNHTIKRNIGREEDNPYESSRRVSSKL